MPDIIVYLLNVNLSVLLFYLGYRLLLRQLTFYALNRYFLLFGVFFSFSFPLVNIRAWFVEQQPVLAEMSAYAFDWEQIPVSGFNYWLPIEGLFWAVALYFVFQLLMRLLSLWRIHHQSLPASWRLYDYRQVLRRVSPFSFWRTIYLHIESHEDDELSEVFKHEQVHVNELHTVDVLLGEILVILCWFNPGAWLLRGTIRENLEFLTDRSVLRSGIDKKAYQYSLLRVSTDAANPALTSSFNFKHLKRRIAMMNTARSSRAHLGKYVFVVPAIVSFVFLFTLTKAYQAAPENGGKQPLAWPSGESPATDGMDVIATEPRAGEKSTGSAVSTIGEKGAADTMKMAHGTVLVTGNQGVGERDTVAVNKPASKVRLRGITKVGTDKQPLVVIDGVIQSSITKVDMIDPNTIQSISVLKDASATARYGSRGANGVILITTMEKAEKERSPEKPVADTTQSAADNLLYLVDDVEISADEFREMSPNDINAIHVWKGQSAEEKYGEKGAKGAVEITTMQRAGKR